MLAGTPAFHGSVNPDLATHIAAAVEALNKGHDPFSITLGDLYYRLALSKPVPAPPHDVGVVVVDSREVGVAKWNDNGAGQAAAVLSDVRGFYSSEVGFGALTFNAFSVSQVSGSDWQILDDADNDYVALIGGCPNDDSIEVKIAESFQPRVTVKDAQAVIDAIEVAMEKAEGEERVWTLVVSQDEQRARLFWCDKIGNNLPSFLGPNFAGLAGSFVWAATLAAVA